MEFQSKPQQECYEKAAVWMKDLFGSLSMAREGAPVFGVVIGSALAQVAVSPWGDDGATITTRAYLVTDVELSADLLLYLLQQNDRMRFGAFGVDQDGDIFFEHTILGASADIGELRSSVLAVVYTADQYDDVIIERWGGTRMLERG